MIQEKAEVMANTTVAPGYYVMTLRCGAPFGDSQPGQFVMLSVGQGAAPLLRRPFSIHRLVLEEAGTVALTVLYKVVGEGTGHMAGLVAGAMVDILGPLGKGFVIRDNYRRVFLAAGGIGVAPMVFLLETLHRQPQKIQCDVFLGGRTHGDLLCRETLERLAHRTVYTTDDGSEGAQCFLTTPLEEAVQQRPPDAIMACGPKDMLICTAGIAERMRVPCQLSVESAMACGMGACLGCAVAAADEQGRYHHVCKDGPVFDALRVRL
jgi:dihydroorotate dehydrogenase electron transfer subunit